MSVNLLKKGLNLKEIICSKYGQTTIENDLIVPDTKPDIAQILQVCAKSVLTQKTVQQDKAYVQGIVNLTIVYIPEGGGIKSIFSTLDFSYITEAKGARVGNRIWAETGVECTEYSILNSRKINIKCCIGVDIKISQNCLANLPTGIDDQQEIQAKYKDYKISCSSAEEDREFHFSDQIQVPSGKPEPFEIIKINAKCVSSQLKQSEERLSASGDLGISILYSDQSGNLHNLEETLPFGETFEGLSLPDGELDVTYLIKDIEFSIEGDLDDSTFYINLNILICGTFRSHEDIEMKGISDAFGTQSPIKLSKNTYKIESIADKNISQIAHKETVAIPDYLPPIYKMCDIDGDARVTALSIENGKINIDGEIISNIIYCSDTDEYALSGMSHITSFCQSVDVPYADINSICEAKVELDHIGYNINSDKSVELRFIIVLSISILKENTVEIIEDIEIDETAENKQLPSALIYFPEENEKVWDIAKRYMTAPESIMQNNNLDSEELHKGQKICIFR